MIDPPVAVSAAPEWQRTSPVGVVAKVILYLRSAALPLAVVLLGGNRFGDNLIVLGIILFVVAGNLLLAGLRWRTHRYAIGADAITVESGLLRRLVRVIPYDRIQDISLEQALVPRLLGLAEVRFETGGGGKDEVSLAYVNHPAAEALRTTIRALRDAAVAQMPNRAEPTAAAETGEPRILFALTMPRLLLFGLFEFSLVFVAVLFGLISQFDFLLPFDVREGGAWMAMLTGQGQRLSGLSDVARLVGGLLVVSLLVLMGFLAGILRAVLRDWGFVLEQTPRGLRRRRGLLTRTDVVMPVHQVQALQIDTGMIRRLFGWYSLSIISLSQDSASGTHTAIPFAQMEDIAMVARVAGFAVPKEDLPWHGSTRRYRFDRAWVQLLVPSLLALLLIALGQSQLWPDGAPGPALPAAGLVLLGSLLAMRQWLLHRSERHVIDQRWIYVRSGCLSPRLSIASRIKLQSLEIRQGPLGQRRGYADLRCDIAGGSAVISGLDRARAHDLRAMVLPSVLAVDFGQIVQMGQIITYAAEA